MGRDHSFADREFGRTNYNPNDRGDFERGLVFIVMAFTGQEISQIGAGLRQTEQSRLPIDHRMELLHSHTFCSRQIRHEAWVKIA